MMLLSGIVFLVVLGWCSLSPADKRYRYYKAEESELKTALEDKLHELSLVIQEGGKPTLSFGDYKKTWEAFKDTHGKTYKSVEEEQHRFDIFKDNAQFIEAHNRKYNNKGSSFWLGLNKFSDKSNEEFHKYNTYRKNTTDNNVCTKYQYRPKSSDEDDVPSAIDWRLKGYVTKVKDQGECGSCWAFSSVGSVEGQWFAKKGELVNFSEQQLVDCSSNYGNDGCNGGKLNPTFTYTMEASGLQTAESYPYEDFSTSSVMWSSSNVTCKFQKSLARAFIIGCQDIPAGNEEALKDAVGTVGPVSVAIDASSRHFQHYSGGIYDNLECSSTDLDHAVLVVGYGTFYGGEAFSNGTSYGGDDRSYTTPSGVDDSTGGSDLSSSGDYWTDEAKDGEEFWIVKNSWGAAWGQQGYIYMSRNKDNQCGVASKAAFPVV